MQGRDDEVYLQLDPGESAVLRTFASDPAPGGPWPYVEAVGARSRWTAPGASRSSRAAPSFPRPPSLRALASWTTLADPEAQRFAGTGRYTVRFDRPRRDADDWLLDLGRVAETARVRLNGRDLGTLWSRPSTCASATGSAPGRTRWRSR